MNQKFLTRLTPALLGAVTLATVGIPQAAQAGTVTGRSNVSFTDVTLQLLDASGGVKIPSIWSLSNGSVTGSGDVSPAPGISVSDTSSLVDGSLDTRTLTSGTAPLDTNGPSFADGSAEISLTGNVLTTGNDAEIFLTGDGPLTGAGSGLYTVSTPSFESGNAFEVEEGDVLDLDGLLNTELFVEITDWEPGDDKFVEADFTASYQISLNGEVVFNGPNLTGQVELNNTNGSVLQTNFINNVSSPGGFDLGGIDYTFLEDGEAEVTFFAREQANGSILRHGEIVPEPSSLAGLLALGGVAFLAKRRHRR